jgi:hypothetical protein
MEGKTTIEVAEKILGKNFLGPLQLQMFLDELGMKFDFKNIPDIPFEASKLLALRDKFILILGVPEANDGLAISIRNMRSIFGINPDVKEPCFYNQDWYLNEDFMDLKLEYKWYLLKKEVIDDSRSKNPDHFLEIHSDWSFPSSILCVFSFFAYYFHSKGDKLWNYDFVWCYDKDHNGDRVYVGKYTDVNGINRSGFSIHRHLSLRNYHGAIFFE